MKNKLRKKDLMKGLKKGLCLGLAGVMLATGSPVAFGESAVVEARELTRDEEAKIGSTVRSKVTEAKIAWSTLTLMYKNTKYDYFGGYTSDFDSASNLFIEALNSINISESDRVTSANLGITMQMSFLNSYNQAKKILDETMQSSLNEKISKYKDKDKKRYDELVKVNDRRKKYIEAMDKWYKECNTALVNGYKEYTDIQKITSGSQEVVETIAPTKSPVQDGKVEVTIDTKNGKLKVRDFSIAYTQNEAVKKSPYNGNKYEAIKLTADVGSKVEIYNIVIEDGTPVNGVYSVNVDTVTGPLLLGDIAYSLVNPASSQEPVVTEQPTAEPVQTPAPIVTEHPTAEPVQTVAPVVTEQPTVAPVATQPPVVTPATKQCIIDFSIIQGEDKSVKIKSGEIEYVKNGINFSKELKDTTSCQLLADDGTLLTVCDVVLTNGVKVDKKVFRVSGDTTCKLDISAFATLAPTVVPTKAPVYTEQPVYTTQPVVTVIPTEVPVVTQQPVYTQVPVYTQAPVYTQNPGSVTIPTYTEKPVVTQQPVVTQAPVDTAQPVVTQQPVQTQSPVVPTIQPTVDPDGNDFSEDNKMEVDPDGSIPEASEDPEASLVCDKQNFKVGVGERFKLPVKGIGVKFKGDSYCTVDRYGYVKAKKVGTSKVVITDGVKTINVTVNVKKAPSKVKFKAKAFKLKAGYIYKLQPILNNKCASYKNKWKSSNKKIFTVSNGKIKALRKGKATVTVTTYNGKSAKAKIVVEK